MDKARRFDMERDFGSFSRWLEARKVPSPARHILPKYGYIVPDVACGFIYLTDSSLGLIEWYVTNPEASCEDRREAMQIITDLLIITGKKNGCKILSANTKHKSIEKIALDNGFKFVGENKFYVMGV